MTENQALEIIGASVFQAHSVSWKKAWDDIRGPFNHSKHSNRIRSDLLREHAAIHGQEILPELGLNYYFDQGQHLFVLPEKALFVYKKLDEGQRAHKNETDRSDRLYQSLLIEDLPTFVVGMEPSSNWIAYTGIFVCRPNLNGVGNAWTINITDGAVAVDSDQAKLTPLIDETESDGQKTKQPKFKPKPKYDPNTGESSEEAGSGGSGGK